MHTLRLAIVPLALAAFCLGGARLYAQVNDQSGEPSPADADAGAPVTTPMEKTAEMTFEEMRVKGGELLEEIGAGQTQVIGLQQVARRQKDIIRLNCVNGAVAEIKQLRNIGDDAYNALQAIADQAASVDPDAATEPITLEFVAKLDGDPYHEYGKIVIVHGQVKILVGEAEVCVGEDLIFLGPTETDADEPEPTDEPWEDPDGFGPPFEVDLEDPGYASAFVGS
jgi:hypothetical protein